MDYAAGMGTAVTAAMDGTITRYSFGVSEPARGVCQSSGGGYGNVVYIEHKGCDGTYTTRYGHLTNKPVPGLREGSKVKKGDLIGYVGGTGGACGRPHLHFELRGPGDALGHPMCDQTVCSSGNLQLQNAGSVQRSVKMQRRDFRRFQLHADRSGRRRYRGFGRHGQQCRNAGEIFRQLRAL